MNKIKNYSINQNQIHIEFEGYERIVAVLGDTIFNFREASISDLQFNIEAKDNIKFITYRDNDNINIVTSSYKVVIKDDFMIDIYQNDNLLSSDNVVLERDIDSINYELLEKEGHSVNKKNKNKFVWNKKINKDDYIYGLGEKTGFLNKRSYDYEMWNTDNPAPQVDCFKALYKSIPFFIVHNKEYNYGYFFDNTYKSYFDLGKENTDYIKIAFDKGNINYFFFGGKTIKDVIEGYTSITGRAPLPQRFTLGHQQSRWSYMNKDELLLIAKEYRKNNIPCDTLFLDIDYMDHYKVFTYSEKSFPNLKDTIEKLNNEGFKVVTIIDPGVKKEVGYKIYDEAIKNDYAATLNKETYINEVWPGEAIFPSFINPDVQKWWSNNTKFLVDLGVRGIWNDMNEPASFKGPLPDNVEFKGKNGKIHYHDEVHNVYAHYMAIATYQGLKEYDKRRPYIITRAAYSGTQKYSTVWTGDNHSIWAHLEMAIPIILNLGLSGFAFSGCDVGGFSSDCTKELLARWVWLGSVTPLFRNHSAMGTRRQEPWCYDEEMIDIYRKAVNFRYRIIPYIYDLFYEAEKTGIPVARPLVLEYENDINTYELNDELMLGKYLIASPIVTQGAKKKMVYLPEGNWYNYFTKEKYNAGYHIVDAPLDSMPIFIKEGAIIPEYPLKQYIDDKEDTLILNIFNGNGEYIHYQDNGSDFKYQKSEYNLYEFKHNDNLVSIKLLHNGYPIYNKIIIKYNNKEYLIDDLTNLINSTINIAL